MTDTGATRVTARTIEYAEEVGRVAYHPHLLQLRDGGDRFEMSLRTATIGPIVIGTLEYLTPVRIRAAEFVDSYQVNLPLYGDVLMSYAGREERASPRRAVVHGPTAPSVMDGWVIPTRILGLKIQRAGVEDALAQALGHPVDRPITFAGPVDVSTRAGLAWAALTRRLDWWARTGDVDAEEGDTKHAGAPTAATLVDAVIGGLLRVSTHEYTRELEDATAASPQEDTRRVLSLMHRRAASQASITDIADEAGVGLRTLEKRFLAEWNRTPSSLLREIRLAYARRNLQRPESAQLLVGHVAARWGLGHPGRFAARYAERFGEAPSLTLARGLLWRQQLNTHDD